MYLETEHDDARDGEGGVGGPFVERLRGKSLPNSLVKAFLDNDSEQKEREEQGGREHRNSGAFDAQAKLICTGKTKRRLGVAHRKSRTKRIELKLDLFMK